ncbi:MAG: hypothetical protein ABFE08_17840 [Armatimonadia bacterium]
MGMYSGVARDNVTITSGNITVQRFRNTNNSPVTKTASFTLGADENFVICNGTGSITVTFPAASTAPGRVVWIKTIAAQTVVSASSNVVPANSATAGTAILADTAGVWAMLVSNGTNWVIMAN